jgi:chromosome partitioning protein
MTHVVQRNVASQKPKIIAIANQKGGVGKTTTAVHLAQGLSLLDLRVLLVDLDPQGNATQGLGINLETLQKSVADLLRDRTLPTTAAIYKGQSLDLLPASASLAQVEVEMVGKSNSETRLAQRLRALGGQGLSGGRDEGAGSGIGAAASSGFASVPLESIYDVVVIDTAPTFGPLLSSALIAADQVIVPVDSNFYAMMGIKRLLAEIEEFQQGHNPSLKIAGFLLTMSDPTNIAGQTFDSLIETFGEQVFETRIRKSVKLREAPALGTTVFHHAPESAGARDYLAFTQEVIERLRLAEPQLSTSQTLTLVSNRSVGGES